MTVRELILWDLLPMARAGLARLGVEAANSHRLLEIIEARVTSGQNGAVWQRRFIEKRGRDLGELTRAYRDRQRTGLPVHSWDV